MFHPSRIYADVRHFWLFYRDGIIPISIMMAVGFAFGSFIFWGISRDHEQRAEDKAWIGECHAAGNTWADCDVLRKWRIDYE